MLGNLVKLRQIAEAQYLRDQERLRGILSEETEIRGKLSRLREMAIAGGRELSTTQTMQGIGADLLWRAWLDKTRRNLNMELARVMARKAPLQDQLRQSFGRKSALEQMLELEDERRRREYSGQRDARLIEQINLGQVS